MRIRWFLAFVVVCVAALIRPQAEVQDGAAGRSFVLRNVTVIDGSGAGPRSAVDVVIEGDRIAALRPTGGAQAPAGAEVHDLTGRVVVPGLVESHLHLQHRYRTSLRSVHAELERMLYGGVVTAREMAGDTRLTGELARAVLAGDVVGPDLYYSALMAGPQFFADDPRPARASPGHRPGTLPWAQALSADTDLRLAVARAAGTLAAGIKLYVQLAPDLVRRVVDEAHRQQLKVWAHSTVYPTRPLELVRAGVDALTHACGLAWQAQALDPAQFARPSLDNRPRFDPALVDPESAEMTALFAEMARRGTLFEPTLAIHARPGDDAFGCTTELTTALTRAAHRSGVALLAGTDFIARDDDPYPSLHQEIEQLVASGVLTPLEAITAATRHGARALGLDATQGTLEAGKIANLVILDGDPSQDIRALRRVAIVIKRGRIYRREGYVPSF